MRVKKLNANRRPRAGEDDGSSSNGSPVNHWVSPTKTAYSPDRDDHVRRADVIEIGANSPTDPTAAPPPVQAHDVAELDLNRHYLPTIDMTNTSDTTQEHGSSSTVPWHDHVNRALREGVHQKIVEYLSTLKPNAPPKVIEKLPGLAYRMEEALFKMATSETEYSDQSTLPQRLTLIQQANAKRLLQQQCAAGSPKNKEPRARKALNEEHARVVFSCLQSWRQKLVNMYSATPWEILPNKILAKVAVYVPSTTQELVVCGVANDQLERFGNSLLQEIEKILNALNANASAAAAAAQQLQAAMRASHGSSPTGTKRPTSSTKSSNGQSKGRDQAANKKRKTATETTAAATVRLAAAAPTFISPGSFIAPTPSLIRPMDPAFLAAAAAASSLPALLPSGANTAAGNGKTPPFFPRIPVPGSTLEQDNRMHLLAQGVGQLSQQQDQQQQQKQQDSEKEIQALRWLLQETQREKALLEAEVQRLRQQGAK